MNIAYLLTGGNLGDRLRNLEKAREAIGKACGRITRASAIFETAAWGKEDQPSFLNQALEIETGLPASELMHSILELETELGRTREEKYGPRIIDIDILFYGNEIINRPGLVIPHPQMHLRRFTLACMNDIAPAFIHPVLHKSIARLLEECPDRLEVNKF